MMFFKTIFSLALLFILSFCQINTVVAETMEGQMSHGEMSQSISATYSLIKGTAYLNSVGTYGTKGVSSSSNMPGARSHSISWTDKYGNLWLFGGTGYTATPSNYPAYLNDLWKYDPARNQWVWISGSNAYNQAGIYGAPGVACPNCVPGARFDSIEWKDTLGNLWLFGGYGYGESASKNGYLNDLWKYDPNANMWTSFASDNGGGGVNKPGTYGTQGAYAMPGSRENAVSWTDLSGNLWLFGGYGYASSSSVGNLNDLWIFNKVSYRWTWAGGSDQLNQTGVYGTKGKPSAGNIPGSRFQSVSWVDSLGNMWLFGGRYFDSKSDSNHMYNDLWKYDPQTKMWTWVSGSYFTEVGVYGTQGIPSAQNVPGPRYGSISWIDASDNLWLSGGYGQASTSTYGYLNDLWKYDPITNMWTWVSGSNVINQYTVYNSSNNISSSRDFSISWIDASSHLWLFGGNGYGTASYDYGKIGNLSDLWKININN